MSEKVERRFVGDAEMRAGEIGLLSSEPVFPKICVWK